MFAQAFSPDGKLLAVIGIDGVIRVFTVAGFSMAASFAPGTPTDTLSFSPDGRKLALGDSNGNVYVYSLKAGYTPRTLPDAIAFQGSFSASNKAISAVQFISDQTVIAGGIDGVARFWTVPAAGKFSSTVPARSLNTHVPSTGAISYSSPLGLLVTAAPGGTRVWDTDLARLAASFCATLKAPIQPPVWHEYLPTLPYRPVCG